jgi:hypothetical protein
MKRFTNANIRAKKRMSYLAYAITSEKAESFFEKVKN